MASPEYQQIWVPDMNNTDCTQGFCSFYCPQWCYIIFPPPPPFGFPTDQSDPNFSPLVIAIIGILASAFLLVGYYTVVAKYCGNWDSFRNRNRNNGDHDFSDNANPPQNDHWHGSNTLGLEEQLIKSITLCKYKRGDGLIEGTDCSVCLSEFQEDESVRLLPKCSHAFHVYCIDTWLRSHSNCPLCRANIVPAPLPVQIQAPQPLVPPEEPLIPLTSQENSQENEEFAISVSEDGLSSVPENSPVLAGESHDRDGDEVGFSRNVCSRALSDLGQEDTVIEIRELEREPIRRSVSMDSRVCLSIADILAFNLDSGSESSGVFPAKDYPDPSVAESSKGFEGEKGDNKVCREASGRRLLHTVKGPPAMKRSFSGGKFLFPRYGRGRNAVLPI
ncbi:hypothetical protein AMTRI_Chr03g52520 [Amborella trichopoda]|uniref:RING-type E3 ubiquitin transferase n=1 Tax=Amborella trichopoda TaxID=13333 RepID=W1NZK5_AMBTC|nr:RING-H2 finger protein ATL52 [Amborella trichopoda]XP_020519793.1 RING-H2 finger protein ATL52 [Amborella trichopoda]XP_020519795.1 RING-H2 finger protein ATL52 [Amborella trichopoda]ERN01108.1 hypothetical protein AMTR_s00002p00198340 [Amborella trichopoda]|eukprot:XP_006838539.1 RING-H2 finger protein ATL52 [Amborella trichopoda]